MHYTIPEPPRVVVGNKEKTGNRPAAGKSGRTRTLGPRMKHGRRKSVFRLCFIRGWPPNQGDRRVETRFGGHKSRQGPKRGRS